MKRMLFAQLVSFVTILVVSGLPEGARADVTGSCDNCHTMHSSQDGIESPAGTYEKLLTDDCIGCHSSNGPEVIVNLGGSLVPIVYNIGGLPDDASTLAGGNFCWVETKGDAYGHNVYGISNEDTTLTAAPGNQEDCNSLGCHFSLAGPGSDSGELFRNKGGCEGCHYYVSHHDTRTPIAYRFLEGHGTGRYVVGVEDPEWEFNATPTSHNEYKGDPTDYGESGTSDLAVTNGMSSFCKGCHQDFHVQSDGSSWVRHPSDAVLPDTGEYALYTTYNSQAPVARPDPLTAAPDVVNHGSGGDMVMCLSCHRAHGSPYPDMLRWDYGEMIAGGGGAEGTGCFVCHTGKDGA